jgi:ABC-2 type transport system ATP-binding protein
MSSVAVEVRELHKRYGDVHAVRGIDLEVAVGEVFALLGPNGAGKTTTVEILEGHRRRSSGHVKVLGHDPGKDESSYKARIGIVLQETGVERFLTVAEVIELFRGYYPDPLPLDEIIELVGLQDKRDVRVRKLSGGQQRRLDVAIGLAGNPELLFLDEPTTGFDPSARRNAWQMVRDLKTLGKTIFLTTHYMEEAQTLADRVAIIADGRIVAEGPPTALTSSRRGLTRISFVLPPAAPALPNQLQLVATAQDGRIVVETDNPMQLLHALSGWALDHEIAVEQLTVSQPSLEEVYLELTSSREDPAA